MKRLIIAALSALTLSGCMVAPIQGVPGYYGGFDRVYPRYEGRRYYIPNNARYYHPSNPCIRYRC